MHCILLNFLTNFCFESYFCVVFHQFSGLGSSKIYLAIKCTIINFYLFFSGLANNKNKKNKNKLPMKGGVPGTPGAPGTSGSGLGSTSGSTGSGNSKMNKPMKTSQIFNLDKNSSWSSLFASRFETIKAVANKRSPTTKPLVVNPSQKNTNKHAAVLAESGITYETPLNPIQVS